MNVNGNNYNNVNPYPTTQNDQAPQTQEAAPSTPTPPANTNNPVAGSSGQNSVTFQTNAEHRAQNTMFLLERMFGDQAGISQRASATPFAAGSIAEYLSTLTTEQARDYIAEDGFWGVERTAERLFDMAYSLSGGNPEELERMRDAVVRGFDAAERAWGSDLPQISHDTLSRTMELFDNFFANR